MFNSSSSLSSSSCKLPVLSKVGREWPIHLLLTWSYQMSNFLNFHDLGDTIEDDFDTENSSGGVITRSKAKSATSAPTTEPSSTSSAPTVDRVNSSKDKKVKAAILLNVAPEIGMHLHSLPSAREVWQGLQEMFCQQSHAARLKIRGDLQNLQQANGETLQEYFARAMSLRLAMQSAGASSPWPEQPLLPLATISQ